MCVCVCVCECDVVCYYLLQAKAIAQPFAYEEYRKERIKKKIEEARANRVKQKVHKN